MFTVKELLKDLEVKRPLICKRLRENKEELKEMIANLKPYKEISVDFLDEKITSDCPRFFLRKSISCNDFFNTIDKLAAKHDIIEEFTRESDKHISQKEPTCHTCSICTMLLLAKNMKKTNI